MLISYRPIAFLIDLLFWDTSCPLTGKKIFAGCKPPFSRHGKSCFCAPPDSYNWQDGRAECHSLGGDLAMIKTAEKQEEAKEYLDIIWEKCNSKYGQNMDVMFIA